MTEGAEQFSLLLEDASNVPGLPDDAARALVETFGLPFPVAQRILASLPALVLKDQPAEVADDVARRLRERGFLVRVRGPARAGPDGAVRARTTTGDVPLVGIRRRTTGAHAVARESGPVAAVGARRTGATGAQSAVRDQVTGQRAAVAESGGFSAVREAATVRTSADSATDARLAVPTAPAPPVPSESVEHPLAGPAQQTPLPFDEPRRGPVSYDEDFSLDRLAEDLPSLDGPPSVPVPRPSVPPRAMEAASEAQASEAPPAVAEAHDVFGAGDARSRMLDELAALDESGISHFAMRPSFSVDGEVSAPASMPEKEGVRPPVAERENREGGDDPSGAFRRVEVSSRRVLSVAEQASSAPNSDAGGFDRVEPSIRRSTSGAFDRVEPSIRRSTSGAFDRADGSIRMAPSEMAGERPKIQFEAAVMATTSSIDEDLQAVTGLYDDETAKAGSGARGPHAAAPVGTRMTGAHAAISGRTTGAFAAVSGPPASDGRSTNASSGAVWKVALVLVTLIVLGVGVQQIVSRASAASVFERAQRLHVTTTTQGGRSVERACADLGEGRSVCRYNVDHYLLAFPALERPAAELAAEQCTSEVSDDGQQMRDNMVCRLRWRVADEEREYMLIRRVIRACDRSLLAMQPGEATTCDFLVEGEFRRGTSLPQEGRVADRRLLRMEGSRETLNTPAGYIDAIEFVSSPVEGGAGGNRLVHYAPAVRDFVREAALGSAPHQQLTYRREPGREEGHWSGAD